jgi:hypothetical protein
MIVQNNKIIKMTIQNYFNLVNDKIEKGDFKIKKSPDFRSVEVQIKSPYLESINYLCMSI